MDGYSLSKNYWDWAFENPELVNSSSSALYFFCIEHCNRLGWKEKFGLPTEMAMSAIGIKNYKTYYKAFSSLVENGFIKVVTKSKNQYSANVIALVENTKANTKALTKAMLKHDTKHALSSVDIDKPINQELLNQEPIKRVFTKPEIESVKFYFIEKTQHNWNKAFAEKQAESFFYHYESNGWVVGKNKMKDWHAAASGWIARTDNPQAKKERGMVW